jgi:hypothetical protein
VGGGAGRRTDDSEQIRRREVADRGEEYRDDRDERDGLSGDVV